ncbi:polysaccharide deacetylase family protein [Aspergillus glaucus CBS 516.65]|uniref:NodB homology domain-containing protein n=1 Tax=Aspergillus glaucus CBS 516.65 TaxID=1160497 RepID=A0A1L9VK82_ASPGL|nr:hypothetical protein ASPGLDRAFT_126058 [Aspergillus glaucus CBS 516.65]OJJ84311.1 hypothetical protein ASPGLDRAFT_126058 [Aspergillus glaucus CBS 516.65]
MEAQLKYRDPFVIDTFQYSDRNNLGFWHGAGENLDVHYDVDRNRGGHYARFYPKDPDQNFHTQVSALHCTNFMPFRERYLHVVFSGSNKFSISLNQNNAECRPGRNPYPATWDTIEVKRYLSGKNDIYVPMSHFAVDLSKIVSVSFNGFYTGESVTLHRIEIIRNLPTGASVPLKLANGQMILKCSRPNSFAFGIDDGQPQFAQEVMNILEEEKVLVTFFVVGQGLRDKDTNFTEVYKEMLRRGHQVALHSNTHQKMETLDEEDIEDEILESIDAFKDYLGIQLLTLTARYFRPPYGTIGARTRQILAARIRDPYIVNWSVDVEDWLWANTDTPERQIEAFTRDVMKGGNLAVMHYLSPSTVAYFRQFIHTIKGAGMSIMRIDQCLEDPNAPPLR